MSRIPVSEAVLSQICRNAWFFVSHLSANIYFYTDCDRSYLHKSNFSSNTWH